ncbi:DUF4375 domain-containing protein [Flavobacterium sp. MC2016-06]|uniref:DMP19 family protein n=1 Tax=Flavobacterium sp. MC2016-06 TaxID=2676308 RepID=UPI0012BA6105|nr:DUF4375 domain-containing protein [Flavobacterium sp. MC2016-06]MBU3858916.1 DUF4375 domain-containing protein [Flavobacterium sp. MC2016-06]
MKKLLSKIASLPVIQFSHSQKTKTINDEPNPSDKKIIIEHLKKDEFASIDHNLIFKPEISKIDFYRLKEMDFSWEVLKPLSEKVTAYCEENELNHRIGIKILTEEQKALYFWWYLDAQVTNGGFSQFIYNGYDKYFPAILNGLKLLPDQKYYNLIEKVYLYYIQEGLENLDRNEVDYFENKFYENDFLSDADELYYKLNKQLYIDFEVFIRKNQSKYIKPIENKFSGEIFEKKANGIEESLFVVDGIPNGYYEKKEKGIFIEKLKYENGIVIEENTYTDGVLLEKITINNIDSTKVKLIFFPNGNIKEENLMKIKSKNNWVSITQKKFFDNGNIEFESWTDNELKKNLKKYFLDGTVKSHSRKWENKDDSSITQTDYLICYDENKKQTLINGKGIFLGSNQSGDNIYEYIVNCEDYKANGESLIYEDGVIWLKENYVKGMKDGIEIEYDEKGNEKKRSEYKTGQYIGKIK